MTSYLPHALSLSLFSKETELTAVRLHHLGAVVIMCARLVCLACVGGEFTLRTVTSAAHESVRCPVMSDCWRKKKGWNV